MWTDGPTLACSKCQLPATSLTLHDERWDAAAKLFVGEVRCPCGRQLLYTRRASQPRPAYRVRWDVTPKGSPMKLFDLPKIGLYLDTITHGTETRREEDVKIVTLVLRVQPFTPQLATVMAEGVKTTLYRLNDASAKDYLKRVDFALGVPRQNLTIYAAPDVVDASIAFTQARITQTYARTEKGVAGFAFIIKASFGPLGRAELEFIQEWHLSQRFVSFEEAEPGMFEDLGVVEEDHDEDTPSRPAAMFDDEGQAVVPAAQMNASNRKLHSHQSKRKPRRTSAPSPDEGDPPPVVQ